ncbi:MAG TPA: NUDIX hydrolase [Acetobacteraceae bacterium]|nr:NUDIX hydrolase [Acetobacteraceae bacterium]
MKTKSQAKRLKMPARCNNGEQCAALPFALDSKGRTRILLMTSRDTGRWVIPKGWTEPELTPAEVAKREAFEEAGLVGRIAGAPVGTYRYAKRLEAGRIIHCAVQVFPFAVERQLSSWPEKRQRQTRWVAPAKAATMVAEPELAAILRAFGDPAPPPANSDIAG